MPHLNIITLGTFLLRCWQESGVGSRGNLTWCFTLVQAEGDRGSKGFANLEELMNTLQQALIQPA